MPLLERVTTLLRANLNDLIDRAEDPEKMLKQVVLDMENQLLQVKTQVAISISDEHLLTRRRDRHAADAAEWARKAALAVARGRDDLARDALDRSLTENRSAGTCAQQLEEQGTQTASLRESYQRLERKLGETRARVEALRVANRRAKTSAQANKLVARDPAAGLDRYAAAIEAQEATNHGHAAVVALSPAAELHDMEREEQINHLLEQLKTRRALAG